MSDSSIVAPASGEVPVPRPRGWRRWMTRRNFLRAVIGSGGAVAGALAYTRFVELHWVEIVRRDLPIRGLPPHLQGTTLVQFSDLHVGRRVSDDFLRDCFREVAAMAPDYVVMTGDWVSYDGPQQVQQLDQLLPDFPRGTRGTFGVLGNHDYGFNWRMSDVAAQVSATAGRHGIEILRNTSARADGLQFVGLDDYWSPHYDPAAVMKRHAGDEATIVLSHNPDVADEPVWSGYQGWILSGHTHGGQCKPPFLPPPLLPVRNRRYTSGAFDVGGGRHLYVNRALGHLLPVRFNVRPEVTVFRLTASG